MPCAKGMQLKALKKKGFPEMTGGVMEVRCVTDVQVVAKLVILHKKII